MASNIRARVGDRSVRVVREQKLHWQREYGRHIYGHGAGRRSYLIREGSWTKEIWLLTLGG